VSTVPAYRKFESISLQRGVSNEPGRSRPRRHGGSLGHPRSGRQGSHQSSASPLLFGSLGTMLNAGSPTYGPSKAALEALSAIMAKDLNGTGVTVNVLVPGGITNTPMVSDHAGFDRAKMI
jgi:NAD(P)-dependent dehydrogenase (short-subunit alcohol dehydrogenase family)